jgi:hypothetical protein
MAVNSTKQEAARTGAAVSGVWGGPQKQRYYTPTGEEIYSIPSWREFTRKGPDGKILEQGTRDANLDKGWSLSLPTELKVACPGCSKWHDTQQEVDACVDKKAEAAAQWERKALEQQPQAQDADMEERLGKLEEGLSDIKALLHQALGVKNG